ncbi:envelope stress response membrane protein PspB [Vibrio sp. SM6]|uniref:Envelope stress response membrane protein PspB n=1 Tax=Vibrio agarilyticus TaxID=2726741 RepID=A0A7X8YFI4_9VIBR|nr:envelope stress response membrane protein PspB [Vibrio agarilyticus]NLS11411.1 envelope stress response membrane protein PspB [Vibrio agarilyticus]
MSAGLIIGPLIVFLIFVAPLWLFLHYRSKRKSNVGLSNEDRMRLDTLAAKAQALQARVDSLERILDAETPNWRGRYE